MPAQALYTVQAQHTLGVYCHIMIKSNRRQTWSSNKVSDQRTCDILGSARICCWQTYRTASYTIAWKKYIHISTTGENLYTADFLVDAHALLSPPIFPWPQRIGGADSASKVNFATCVLVMGRFHILLVNPLALDTYATGIRYIQVKIKKDDFRVGRTGKIGGRRLDGGPLQKSAANPPTKYS